jgi:hypothetical protein
MQNLLPNLPICLNPISPTTFRHHDPSAHLAARNKYWPNEGHPGFHTQVHLTRLE